MGGVICDNIKVLGNASVLSCIDYDEIVIGTSTGFRAIYTELLDMGIPKNKINTRYVQARVEARIIFLKQYSELASAFNNENLAIAEGGVYQGEFARRINKYFPHNELYLFDTFEGFDSRDVAIEQAELFSQETENHFSSTSVDLVLAKLPYKEQAHICKGYFPETANGLEHLRFVFVSLDFDLYKPTLAGLDFFYPRLVDKAVLMLDGYFFAAYSGVRKAVDDYEHQKGIRLLKLPIGDGCGVAIVKV